MKNVEVKLYKFGELKKEIQEKLLKKEIEVQRDFARETYLYDDLFYLADSLLKSTFEDVTNLELYYSFGYCQGDGVVTEFRFTFKNEIVVVKLNPYNHYTYCSNFLIDTIDDSNINNDELEELKGKIFKINKKLETEGYNMLEDDEGYKEQALEYLNQLEDSFLENGEYFNY